MFVMRLLWEPPGKVARDYIDKVSDLEGRVRGKMEEFELTDDRELGLEACRRICDSGLVAEITLLPYGLVRDYLEAMCE